MSPVKKINMHEARAFSDDAQNEQSKADFLNILHINDCICNYH